MSVPGMTVEEARAAVDYKTGVRGTLLRAVNPHVRARSYQRQELLQYFVEGSSYCLYFGGNDLSHGRRWQDILEDLKQLGAGLGRDFFVCTLLPRPSDSASVDSDRRLLNSEICREFGRHAVDLVPPVLHKPRSRGVNLQCFTADGMHLSRDGVIHVQNHLVKILCDLMDGCLSWLTIEQKMLELGMF